MLASKYTTRLIILEVTECIGSLTKFRWLSHTVYCINYKHTVRNRWKTDMLRCLGQGVSGMQEPCYYPDPGLLLLVCYCYQFVPSLYAAQLSLLTVWLPGRELRVSKGTWQMEDVWSPRLSAVLERGEVFTSEHSCNFLFCMAVYLNVFGRWHMRLEWGSPRRVGFRMT